MNIDISSGAKAACFWPPRARSSSTTLRQWRTIELRERQKPGQNATLDFSDPPAPL
jgi:hypothetical protein